MDAIDDKKYLLKNKKIVKIVKIVKIYIKIAFN